MSTILTMSTSGATLASDNENDISISMFYCHAEEMRQSTASYAGLSCKVERSTRYGKHRFLRPDTIFNQLDKNTVKPWDKGSALTMLIVYDFA
jgi:hypothetical protein